MRTFTGPHIFIVITRNIIMRFYCTTLFATDVWLPWSKLQLHYYKVHGETKNLLIMWKAQIWHIYSLQNKTQILGFHENKFTTLDYLSFVNLLLKLCSVKEHWCLSRLHSPAKRRLTGKEGHCCIRSIWLRFIGTAIVPPPPVVTLIRPNEVRDLMVH